MIKNVFALILLVTTLSTYGQTKNFLDQPYLETTASVDTLVTPDRIYLGITITEKDTRGKKSVEEQENKMAKELKTLGIDLQKQLFIDDMGSSFKRYFLKGQEVLKSKNYTLLVYDGLTAGKVLAALEEIDIANTRLVKTEYSKMEAMELELKSKAVIKAQKKGIYMTAPLGQKIGPAIHIVDNTTPYYPAYQRSDKVLMFTESATNTPEPLDIDFEKIKVQTSINIKFALLQ
jgi:uncharacterized protein YggE